MSKLQAKNIVGAFPMKGLPLHRGQLAAILKASTMCDLLYVVISDNRNETKKYCKDIKYISLEQRMVWVSQEVSGFDHIKVVGLDETDIPAYPNGWEPWSELVKAAIPEKFHVIFGNEDAYRENYKKYLPDVEYITFDLDRDEFKISGTEIRDNPMKYWHFITGSARPFFCKKVLITGGESCGKSTMVKKLAKIFHTSWSEEAGKYYSGKYLGGVETAFTPDHFERICWLQHEQDLQIRAQHASNRVSFHDTDALITNFYLDKYLGTSSNFILEFAKRQEYDLIILLTPDVPWVADGIRWISDQKERNKNHEIIRDMYLAQKPGTPIIEVSGNYSERLDQCMHIVRGMIGYDI